MDKIEQRKQIEIFEELVNLAYIDNIDLPIFIYDLLLSEEGEEILKYSDLFFFYPLTIYAKYKSKYKLKKADDNNIEIAIYAIFIYLKFYQLTNESMANIFKILPYEEIINNYHIYHTYDEKMVIYLAKYKYNLKMNPIRKTRCEQYDLSNQNETYLLFLARRIFLKLFFYPSIESTKYHERFDLSYLMNEDTFIYSKYINNLDEINDVINNRTINHLSFDKKDSIIFFFLNDGVKVDKDFISSNYLHNKEIEIKTIITFYNGEVHIFDHQHLETIFYIPLTNLDTKTSTSEMINNGIYDIRAIND